MGQSKYLSLYLKWFYFHSNFSDSVVEGENAVSRYLARIYPNAGLYGSTALETSQVIIYSWYYSLNVYYNKYLKFIVWYSCNVIVYLCNPL